jgi:hypothetical protein
MRTIHNGRYLPPHPDDASIPMDDAIRAYRDRPSMEKELQELREQLLATEKARDSLRGALEEIETIVEPVAKPPAHLGGSFWTQWAGRVLDITNVALSKKEFDAELEYKNAPDMPITEEEREAIVKRVIAETVLSKKEE